MNLISGIQLDKAGVISTLENKLIMLAINGTMIVKGKITNDMYHLYLKLLHQIWFHSLHATLPLA
jgi:hypothetical protein